MSNRLELLTNYLLKKEIFPTLPVDLVVETTNRCNLKCIMCPREKMSSPVVDMHYALFKKIIDESATFVELVDLSFRGEPLLNRNIFDMVRYAKSKKVKTYLQTNATLLTLDRIKELFESGLDIAAISLDALTPSVYAKIRKGAHFDDVIKNVEALLMLKNKIKNNTHVVLQIIPMAENYPEVKDFIVYWRKHPSFKTVRIKPFSTRAGLVQNPLYPYNSAFSNNKCNHRCFRLWRSLAVYADGTVVPCCYDYQGQYVLGNLNIQTIKEIWMSAKMAELRKRHIYADFFKLEPCSKCEMLDMNIVKQAATFILDSVIMHKALVFFNHFLRMNKFSLNSLSGV